jgi:Mce-associated membrane protein
MADTDKPPRDSTKARLDAISLAEQAEAEATEAEALAAAARARARAIQLRREAEAQAAEAATEAEAADKAAEAAKTAEVAEAVEAVDPTKTVDPADTADPIETAEHKSEPSDTDAPEETEAPEEAEATTTGPRLQVSVSVLLTAATIVVICALLGASGWMAWHHHKTMQEREQSAAFISTARQGIINLTSLDFKKSKEDVQRILDSATGEFRDQFQKTAEDFASVVKDTKAVAEGSVAAAAVESRTNDSAVVLILANERVTNVAGAKDQPRTFRFRVSVVRDGDQLKLSKVEFVL